jgi:hypothetical protein
MLRSVFALSLLIHAAGYAQTQETQEPLFLTNATKEGMACAQALKTGIHTRYSWRLVRLNGRENPIPPTKIWVSRDAYIEEIAGLYLNCERRRVTVIGSCNNFYGEYHQDDGKIEFALEQATTRRVCPSAMAEEEAFLKALENTRSWERQDHVLRFYDASRNLLLEMEER